MTPSPVGLLDNCSRRSSSPVQLPSEVGVVVSDPAEGCPGEATSVKVLASGGPTSGACIAAGAGGVSGGASLSSSARANCAWGPSG